MISFLNSGILFLASAIVIPILIYLFARKRPKKIVFSTIRFIKESQQQQKKRINLKNLLLLLLRMLIILLVILAISRPAIKSELLSGDSNHPKTAIALIIDNSYSMNYLVDTQTEFDKVKEIVLQINQMLNADDIIIPISADANWNELHSNPIFGRIQTDLISSLELTPKAVPLQELLEFADRELSKIHLPNREIIMISDLQSFELPDQMQIPTFIVPTSAEQQRINLSCENSRLVDDIIAKSLQKKISFELVNHSNLRQQDVIYRLFLDGNTIAEKVTDLQPNQRKTEFFEISMETEGWHGGYVEVKNERLIFDNRNYFSFYYDSSLRIAVLSEMSKLPLALETILEIYTGKNGEIQFFAGDDFNRDILETFDNIVVYDKYFSPRLEFILNDLEQRKIPVLFIADRNLSSDWREFLSEKFQLQFLEFANLATSTRLSFSNLYHPITREIKNIGDIRFNDFWQTTSSPQALFKAGELPLAVHNAASLLWLFDVNSLQNPFLLDNAFPVFAYNSLRFTSRTDQIVSRKKVGEPIRAERIILPDGREIKPGNKRLITRSAGIYKTSEKQIPVNLDYSESNYSRLSASKIKNLKILSDNWQDHILHSRYGFEIWKYLLITALALLVLEMLIVKKAEKK